MKFEISDRMSKMKGSAIREIFKLAGDPKVISLAGGNPAPELFPNKELSEIARLLGSDSITEAVLANAKELKEMANQTKGY